jgi:hypothetical protein
MSGRGEIKYVLTNILLRDLDERAIDALVIDMLFGGCI